MPARLFAAAVLASLLCAHGQPVRITATRIGTQPLLKPGALPWAASGIFNPAAIAVNGRTILLFRARDAKGVSSIGYAESRDGIHFDVAPEPVLSAEMTYERGGGVEDPRLVRIDGVYYLTYTGYNGHDAQLCLAMSSDLRHWHRQGVVLPAYKGKWNTGWTKSGAIVPRRIAGRWWMYYLGTKRDADGKDRDYMGLAWSQNLLQWTDATDRPVLERHPAAFDSRVMEPGPPPLITSRGILLLYNGANEKLVYGPAWALFDARDPTRLIARAQQPFMLPQLEWERIGTVSNVIFLEGAIRMRAKSIDLTGYYGAADKYIGAMRIHIAE